MLSHNIAQGRNFKRSVPTHPPSSLPLVIASEAINVNFVVFPLTRSVLSVYL